MAKKFRIFSENSDFFKFFDNNLRISKPKILKFCTDMVNTIMNVSEKYQKI